LHRMYWIPSGAGAADGVYVHYKAEEFYAVLSLESHRRGGQIVGENLGTVPEYANEALTRHRIFGLHVGQFGVAVGTQPTLAEVPPGNIASLNTHDMATFAGFWTGNDIEDRFDLGLLDEAQVGQEKTHRAAQRTALVDFLRRQKLLAPDSEDPSDVLQAWLCFMATHGADLLLVNLEDLWLETLPQNVPGTWRERPNWQRKARHSIAALQEIGAVMNILTAVNRTRTETEPVAQAEAAQVN